MVSISNVYIQTFERTLRHLAQQSEARLRAYVTETAQQSEKHNWEHLDAGAAVQKSTARENTPTGGGVGDLAWGRRVSLAETWHAGETTEQEDIVQMLVDPNSNVAQNLGMAMSRAVDDILITAATGPALVGDGSTSTFPPSQEIGDATTLASLDIILQVQEVFGKNDVDPSINKCFVINPTIQRRLMQLLEVTSSDFQSVKALATGVLPNFMGFTWIVSNRLAGTPGTDVECLAFSPKAIGLHVAKDITAKIAERPDLSFAWQIYSHMTMGAVRVEDKHIVKVTLKDDVV